jgi:hypothetical protein
VAKRQHGDSAYDERYTNQYPGGGEYVGDFACIAEHHREGDKHCSAESANYASCTVTDFGLELFLQFCCEYNIDGVDEHG